MWLFLHHSPWASPWSPRPPTDQLHSHRMVNGIYQSTIINIYLWGPFYLTFIYVSNSMHIYIRSYTSWLSFHQLGKLQSQLHGPISSFSQISSWWYNQPNPQNLGALASCRVLNSSNAEIHCAKGRISPAGGNQPGIHFSPLGRMNQTKKGGQLGTQKS